MPSPNAAEFEAAARAVLDRLPRAFREQLVDVVLRIEEFASAEQLAAVGMQSRWELTGLYEGIALTEQSQWDHERMPPVISLFRQPLLAEMHETRVGFAELVRHVVIHEAGHHFGFSDADMHALEASVGE
ncbi:metallopeptidase family protein [Erythrobacter sanguineus]|uniref:Predicted Zn-dependent protease, minimal metalloprotease (MMP)-like domain n=1 Tax=Erythrobacter sanguineus TaxID=198312 RepID=A0A1M7RUT7_9SPHN|nr:metallopeptidase family protein [Erythrobacter sanguineus]SHN49858.1 Predicted Zn-dependent protease, minimal metalloprotease (MMP)-like domain [Erythrobacter sanguineus]